MRQVKTFQRDRRNDHPALRLAFAARASGLPFWLIVRNTAAAS